MNDRTKIAEIDGFVSEVFECISNNALLRRFYDKIQFGQILYLLIVDGGNLIISLSCENLSYSFIESSKETQALFLDKHFRSSPRKVFKKIGQPLLFHSRVCSIPLGV